ncbi:hypothetical protein ACFOLD_02880 [Kocuria carniphila]
MASPYRSSSFWIVMAVMEQASGYNTSPSSNMPAGAVQGEHVRMTTWLRF